MDWVDWDAIASFVGADVDDLIAEKNLSTPQQRAQLVADVANHDGWINLDSDPLRINLRELAERWGEKIEEENAPTLYLDNRSGEGEDPPMVTLHITGPNSCQYARDEGSVQGSGWECSDDDFAYAIVTDRTDLEEDLEKDGWDDINTDDYYPPDEDEDED